MKTKNTCMSIICFGIFFALLPRADAVTLYADPANSYFNSIAYGSESNNLDAAYFSSLTGHDLTEFYKDNGPGESGPLAGSYETDLVGGSTTGDVTVSYIGGDVLSGQMFAYAKDGNSDPNWFLWDLTALGWDGTSNLVFDGPLFFRNDGTIVQAYSHITLLGDSAEVPDGGPSLALLGLVLIGMGAVSFRAAV